MVVFPDCVFCIDPHPPGPLSSFSGLRRRDDRSLWGLLVEIEDTGAGDMEWFIGVGFVGDGSGLMVKCTESCFISQGVAEERERQRGRERERSKLHKSSLFCLSFKKNNQNHFLVSK